MSDLEQTQEALPTDNLPIEQNLPENEDSNSEQIQETKENEEEQNTTRHPGREYIDLKALGVNDDAAKKIQDRIDYMARGRIRADEAKQYIEKVAYSQQQEIEELKQQLSKIQSAYQEESIKEEIETLKLQRKQAREIGNDDEADRISSIINKIELENMLGEFQQKQKTKQNKEPETISQQDQQILNSWSYETDANGMFKRPWAVQGHPKYAEAVQVAVAIAQEPETASLPFEKRLYLLEQFMNKDKAINSEQKTPPVLSGKNLPSRTNSNKLSLTKQQEAIALKMFPRAKTPEDAFKLYAKGLTTVKGK